MDENCNHNLSSGALPVPVAKFLKSLIDPERYGWAVSAEVRREAIKLLNGERNGIKDRYE